MPAHTDGHPAQFAIGDRVFSHYVMDWGTVTWIGSYQEPCPHGVTGSMLPGSRWYDVKMDKGRVETFDDANGDWDLARCVPPSVARKYGYGDDPKA